MGKTRMNECCESNVILIGTREYKDETHLLWICTKCDNYIVTINGLPVELTWQSAIYDDADYTLKYLSNECLHEWTPWFDVDLQYQLDARKTLLPISKLPNLAYLGLGLSDEAGEVSGKIKKVYRDANGEITPETKAALNQELGDVLWYLTNICTEIQMPLSEIMDANIKKLSDRQERNMIQGNGDNR